MILEKVYDELMAQIEDLKKAVAALSGGTDDYDDLSNRPKVNNITLTGNKKSSDLKIAYSMTEAEYAAATKNAESIYCLQENATTFEEEDESASSYIEWSAGDPSGYVATWVYAPSNQNFTGCTAVECDDAAITVEGFSVIDGNVQVYLSCDDTAQIGETVTFTYTLTQPAGSTRITKNGVEFGVNPFIFSTTEQKVGEWINGKPVYQTSFQIPTSAATSETISVTLADKGIIDLDDLISFNAITTIGSGGFVGLEYYDTGSDNFKWSMQNKTALSLARIGSWSANQTVSITMQYTKTTD